MKLKIKVKVLTEGCMPVINKNGDWIDLRSAKHRELEPARFVERVKIDDNIKEIYHNLEIPAYYIPLGISMKLPKGFEAIVASRSSGPNKLGLFIPNGEGIIDNTYSGNEDEWHYVCSPMRETNIEKGDRVCQFRVQLSQKATIWQKLKWLFSSGIELIEVKDLDDTNRGGFGSSGVK